MITQTNPGATGSYIATFKRPERCKLTGRAELNNHPDPLRRIAWFAPWRWSRLWQRLAIYPLVIAGYPLSYGPVWASYDRGWLPQNALLIYMPMLWAVRSSPTIDRWYGWYLSLFF